MCVLSKHPVGHAVKGSVPIDAGPHIPSVRPLVVF
jgi:hypothetical protein